MVHLKSDAEPQLAEVGAQNLADALDIHYIESCKMLTSCSACDKIIEIARLSQHMLNECEHRDKV